MQETVATTRCEDYGACPVKVVQMALAQCLRGECPGGLERTSHGCDCCDAQAAREKDGQRNDEQ